MLREKLTRDLIAAALRSVADEVCIDHHGLLTQEPQLTSRIGQALETKLSRKQIENYRIRVVTQDFPDRGRGSLESKSGADLYVGVEVVSGPVAKSKGFLVQAKWAGHNSREELERLEEQCRKMLRRTDAAYVWVYGNDGVRVLPAQNVLRMPPLQRFRGRPLDDLFSRVLECSSGDPAIGIPPQAAPRKMLASMLEELSVATGVLVQVEDTLQG